MTFKASISMLTLLVGAVFSVSATAGHESVFHALLEEYEAIRLQLLDDSLDHVAHRAETIRQQVSALEADFDAGKAGVDAGDVAECRALLPEVSAAAHDLAMAGDLEVAREAFFALSKPMGRYRKLAGIEGSIVVYCSMEKKAWIQPTGKIGNPYGGQMMPTCGQVIAD